MLALRLASNDWTFELVGPHVRHGAPRPTPGNEQALAIPNLAFRGARHRQQPDHDVAAVARLVRAEPLGQVDRAADVGLPAGETTEDVDAAVLVGARSNKSERLVDRLLA